VVIFVNSKQQIVPADCTVDALLDLLAVKHKRLAVEVNAELVTKTEWGTFKLKDGDRVEVVTFVGGG
jgi:thiamine biosynthesis protein ThiS